MGVNITRAASSLGRTVPSADAVICAVFSGAVVAGTAALLTPYQIFGTAGLTPLGITLANNPVAYQDIIDFYGIAGEGAEFNFMLVDPENQLGTICDIAQPTLAKALLDFTDGRAVVFVVNVKKPNEYEATITNGLDEDVWTAAQKLNAIAVAYQTNNVPFVGILPGLGFTAATLANLTNRSTLAYDNVAINLACAAADGHVSMGILAGVLAKCQVHVNCGAVANGAVTQTAFYPDGSTALALKNSAESITTKGYIQFVKRGSKSGYYFNDDPTLTAVSGDYTSISWNRVINKAQRIAYDVLIEKLNGDVDINASTGKVETSVISDWESDVQNAIKKQMMQNTQTVKPEIDGISCTIDANSNIVNDEMDGTIQIVRKGQAKTINVAIGYANTI